MSPHFGLMDPSKMTQEDAALMRAKLHWRSGKQRLAQGDISEGLAVLYDALFSAMRWYIIKFQVDKLNRQTEKNLEDEEYVVSCLEKRGILESTNELDHLKKLVDKTLMDQDVDIEVEEVLDHLQDILTRLGVLPFDEKALPPEVQDKA